MQELKVMLQLERQEIQNVVASKTQVIREQERSIEQLECELSQLKHGYKSSSNPKNENTVASQSHNLHSCNNPNFKSRGIIHLHGQNPVVKSKLITNPSTVYSFPDQSSACRSSHCEMAYHNGIVRKHSLFNQPTYTNHNHLGSNSPALTRHISIGQKPYFQNQLKQFTTEHDRPGSKVQLSKTCGLGFDHLGRPQCLTSYGGCDSNLLYLSKTSEDMGIPLSHLIEQSQCLSLLNNNNDKFSVFKTSKSIQRGFSDTKLSPKF